MSGMARFPFPSLPSRLLLASLSLLLALLMLVGASYAWFSLSTHPEIGGIQVTLYTSRTLLVAASQEGEYGQRLDLSDPLSRYVELKPVSTADGIHWYLPTYEAIGLLKDPSQFYLDTQLDHANVAKFNASGQPLQGLALKDARAKGYYVYADFWLKTEEPACLVRLSVPGQQTLDEWEIRQGTYGTYALSLFTRPEGEEIAILEPQAQTALRAGFLCDPDDPATRSFTIFEPNADQRSSLDKPRSGSGQAENPYVAGYDVASNLANYQEGSYIPTHPIGPDPQSPAGSGLVVDPDFKRLIIQKKSVWDLPALEAVLLAQQRQPGSNEVATMGRFVADTQVLAAAVDPVTGMAPLVAGVNEAIAGEPVIIRLAQEIPRKIRLFFWIEGQDVDCWNDIATGSFAINLELAGETTTNPE
ncbi:MAG: hypothetical protein EOM70_08180 [Clostridia bacterium]|nr:hypothetical protein [Clostridia bacterium]